MKIPLDIVDLHVYGGALLAAVCISLVMHRVEFAGGVFLGLFLIYVGLRQ
jgi:fucose permease